jgi:peptide/nickel transport system permease protein
MSPRQNEPPLPLKKRPLAAAWLARGWNSDLAYKLRGDTAAAAAALAVLLLFAAAALAPVLSPVDPYDLSQVSLTDSLLPPAWMAGGEWRYLLGTDDQGRDLLSAILFGLRLSLIIGLLSVAASMLTGTAIGLVAGFAGGFIDALIMRIADFQLSFPAILIAFLTDGVARAALPPEIAVNFSIPIVVTSIALSGWVQYARTARGSVIVERSKDYVHAARVIGVSTSRIAIRHVLPNVIDPLLVLATVQVATAIVTEATLSFLGAGMPGTQPSLGTLVRTGSDYLFSGEWWVAVFPGLTLVAIVFSTNLFGDWLRDATNPRLN